MPICSNCGANNQEGFEFCIDCGKPLVNNDVSTETSFLSSPKQMSITGAFINGFAFMRVHPKIFLILLFTILIDFLLQTILLSQLSYLSVFLETYISRVFNEEITQMSLNLLTTYLIGMFFLAWILISYRETRRSQTVTEGSFNLGQTFRSSFDYLFRIFVAEFLIGVLTVIISFILLIPYNLFRGFLTSSPVILNDLLIYILVIGFTSYVLFTYTYQAIVFNEASITDGLDQSIQFTRRNFLRTIGIVVIFGIIPPNFVRFLILRGIFFPTDLIFVLSPILRFIELIRTICLAWVFYEYQGKNRMPEAKLE